MFLIILSQTSEFIVHSEISVCVGGWSISGDKSANKSPQFTLSGHSIASMHSKMFPLYFFATRTVSKWDFIFIFFIFEKWNVIWKEYLRTRKLSWNQQVELAQDVWQCISMQLFINHLMLLIHTGFNYNYRYLTYKKCSIDLWEELCGWRNGTKRSYNSAWTLGKALQFVKDNGELVRPLFGNYSVKIDRNSQDYFAVAPMMPSGMNLMHLNVTEADHKIWRMLLRNLFFYVSDHRVTRFWFW